VCMRACVCVCVLACVCVYVCMYLYVCVHGQGSDESTIRNRPSKVFS